MEDYVHDFHFIVDKGMKERIKGLEIFKDCRGVSGIIVRIIKLLAPVVKREHKWGEQRMGRYRHVCENHEEEREDMHVYLPGKVYRELKLLHQDLNTYSVAQLLRGFLELFLGFVDVYGGGVVRELKKIFARWRKEEKETRLTPREVMRQLMIIIQHLPGKSRPINIYDSHFSPFWVLRI